MRHLALRIIVALFTFSLGLIAYAVLDPGRPALSADEKVIPVFRLREEAWHKLYEAAAMSGDPALLRSVRDRLICTNADAVSDARLVEINGRAWCMKADGTAYELNFNRGLYGSFGKKIIDGHPLWSLKNLSFVKTISTPQKAKEYVIEHR